MGTNMFEYQKQKNSSPSFSNTDTRLKNTRVLRNKYIELESLLKLLQPTDELKFNCRICTRFPRFYLSYLNIYF